MAIKKKAERVLVATRDQRNIENQFQADLTLFMETETVCEVFKAY